MTNHTRFRLSTDHHWGRFLVLTLLFTGIMTALLLYNPSVARAHAGGQRYHVAERGQDRGPCLSPLRPCRTIAYALRQATGQGDEIRVVAGTYTVDDATAYALVASLLLVQGGYTTADYFATAAPQLNLTYLVGVPRRYHQPLAAQGFILLPDKATTALVAPPATNAARSSIAATHATCHDGQAAGHACQGIDLLAHLSLDQLSSLPTTANDIWGHTDLNDGHEYALLGLRNGTAIIDVTDPFTPREIVTIPGLNNLWRDIKVYQRYDEAAGRWRAYAYVTTEAEGQGMQIIDLSELPTTATLAATYTGIASAHNVYLGEVDYSTGVATRTEPVYAYLLGSNVDNGAFRILDLSNPIAPSAVTAPPRGTQYVHDSTTFVITDTRTSACAAGHNPCTLLVDYNENSVDLWDVTDKGAPYQISSTAYAAAQYTHSGWWSADKRYLFVHDELDEYRLAQNTQLRVLDLNSLTAPISAVAWTGPTKAIDHNGFVKGTRYYISNYERGLTILDVRTPTTATEIGFFDTYPAGDAARFNGAWGVYPYLPSGNLLVSDIQGGLFVLREALPPTSTATPTATPSPTVASTATPTPQSTPTATPTVVTLPIPTSTATSTVTPVSVIPTPTPTTLPTATRTATPPIVLSATPTPTASPTIATVTSTPRPTVMATVPTSSTPYTIYLPVVSR